MNCDLDLRILRYLVDHPAAMDTAEGILAWWLPAELQVNLSELEQVLTALVDRGWVASRGEGQSQTYGLDPCAMNEIAQHIEEAERRG